MKKKSIFKTLFAALVLLGGTFAITSCLDNDSNEDMFQPVTVTDVVGTYSGQILTAQGNVKMTKNFDFAVLGNVISAPSFPVNAIVENILQDNAKAAEVLKTMGKIQYDIDYTAKLASGGKEVQLVLVPKALIFKMTVDGVDKNVNVQFSTQYFGSYTSSTRGNILSYMITADKITVDNTELQPYDKISYVVSAAKN